MITRLAGKLIDVGLTEVVVDVAGVGFAVSVPMSTYDRLPSVGDAVVLLTHFSVREDNMQLYGFATDEERKLFRMVNTVSGIGPRIAMNILSCMSVASFCQIVALGDTKALSRVNGIGKRSAERLVVELRERVGEIEPASTLATPSQAAAANPEVQDAIAALATLGFKGDAVRKAVHRLCNETPAGEQTAENLIRKALNALNS